MDWVKQYEQILSRNDSSKLVELKQGTYVVRAARKVNSQFGKKIQVVN